MRSADIWLLFCLNEMHRHWFRQRRETGIKGHHKRAMSQKVSRKSSESSVCKMAHRANRVLEDVQEVEANVEDNVEDDSEGTLSSDTGVVSDLSENLTLHRERYVSQAELRALTQRTKHCMIQCYYSTGGALALCASCMIELRDTELYGMNLVLKHKIDYEQVLSGRYCSNCRVRMYVIIPCSVCPMCTNQST